MADHWFLLPLVYIGRNKDSRRMNHWLGSCGVELSLQLNQPSNAFTQAGMVTRLVTKSWKGILGIFIFYGNMA